MLHNSTMFWLVLTAAACGGSITPTATPEGAHDAAATDPAPPAEAPWTEQLERDFATAPVADLRVAGPSAMGGRSRDDLHSVLAAQQTRVRYCYEMARREGSEPEGTVTVRLGIGPDGAVQAAEVIENQTGSSSFGDCVLSAARRAVFPAAEGRIVVILPFALQGGGLQ